uniref:Leucine-rich repeat-containing N-terminal plant-type domain-containing protein n=1 Tax=Ananas comosus var. bracteatus TaxID=296719 RepID=A0A6V7PHV2_ANACO|nr:unnamed protein product [Ananas comosus var. bracteatus]
MLVRVAPYKPALRRWPSRYLFAMRVGRRSGLPWKRLIPRVRMLTTTGPLGSAPVRQPTGGSQSQTAYGRVSSDLTLSIHHAMWTLTRILSFLPRSPVIAAVALSSAIATRAYKRLSLDLSGVILGFLVTAIHIAARARLRPFDHCFRRKKVQSAASRVLSSKLTKIGQEKKRLLEEEFKEGGSVTVSALKSLMKQWKNTPPSWQQSKDPCSERWDGVICTKSRVTTLKLFSMGLEGTLSDNIGKFDQLQTLILFKCSFTGTILDELGNLRQLTFLTLNSNKFIGRIPATLGKLSNLSWLDLADNQLNGTLPVSMNASPGLDQLLNAQHL